MTPFLQARLWMRRGPRVERVAVAIASVLVLALAAWALIPVDDGEQSAVDVNTGAPTAAGAQAQSGVTNGAANGAAGAAPGVSAGSGGAPVPASDSTRSPSDLAAAPGGAVGGGGGSAGAAAADGSPAAAQAVDACAGVGASDQGVTAKDILVAVPIVDLGGAVTNETFGVRPDLEAVANAAAEGVNGDGGVGCRKLRIKTYRVNPINPEEQRSKCLQIAATKPFAIVDAGGFGTPVARSCFLQAKLPYQGVSPLSEEEVAANRPYMYSVMSSIDRSLRNWVSEAAARGSFDAGKGFKKLGLLLETCYPKVNEELKQNLAKVGVAGDRLSIFTMSCAAVASPDQINRAMLQHHNDGVSHVFLGTSISNAQSYVQNADGLRWRPVYQASDYGLVTQSVPADGWSDGFDGTIGITSQKNGEINSGIVNPRTAQCRGWIEKAKVRPDMRDGSFDAAFCDMFRLFAAAVMKAGPNPTRSTVLDGLAKVGRFETALWGDGVYDRPGKVTGGDLIRAIRWQRDCRCWKVIDRDMKVGR